MSRRRYVWDPEQGCTVEVGGDYVGQRRNGGLTSEAEVYGNLQATDGTDISSRRKHREYMAHNGLAMAEDYTDTWAKARAERDRLRTTSEAVWTEGGEPVRRGGGPVEHSRDLPSIRAAVVESMKRAGKL